MSCPFGFGSSRGGDSAPRQGDTPETAAGAAAAVMASMNRALRQQRLEAHGSGGSDDGGDGVMRASPARPLKGDRCGRGEGIELDVDGGSAGEHAQQAPRRCRRRQRPVGNGGNPAWYMPASEAAPTSPVSRGAVGERAGSSADDREQELPEEQNEGYWRDVEDGELNDDEFEEDDEGGNGDNVRGAVADGGKSELERAMGVRPNARHAAARRALLRAEDEAASEWSLISSGASSHTPSDDERHPEQRRRPSSRCHGTTAAEARGGGGDGGGGGEEEEESEEALNSRLESQLSLLPRAGAGGGLCGDCEPVQPWELRLWASSRDKRLNGGAAAGAASQVPSAPQQARRVDGRAGVERLDRGDGGAAASSSTSPPSRLQSRPIAETVMDLPTEQRGSAYIREAKGRPLYYDDYLKLGRLLSCQDPMSWRFGEDAHDEMLFITVHQTYELWFKQLIHELDSVRYMLQACVSRPSPSASASFSSSAASSTGARQSSRAAPPAPPAPGGNNMNLILHRLERMVEIQRLLVEQIRVLETMTPREFLTFRDYLFPASGFQSWQFRLLEIKLGVRAEQRISNHWKTHLSHEHQQLLTAAEREPSLFELTNAWLEQLPFADFGGYNFRESYERATERMLQLDRDFIEQNSGLSGADRARAYRDLARTRNTFCSVYNREAHAELVEKGQRRMSFEAMATALLIMLYEHEAPYLQLPHRVLQRLVDLDELISQWRFRHAQMAGRMIGAKMGTGGSLGAHYLSMTVDTSRVFTDLSGMATLLIPQRLLPELPREVRDYLAYAYTRLQEEEEEVVVAGAERAGAGEREEAGRRGRADGGDGANGAGGRVRV